MAARLVTVGTGQTFATLLAALQDEFTNRPDLGAAGGVLTVQCHFISGGDTTWVNFPAFTNPTENDYIHIIAADNHGGEWNDTDCYYINISGTPALNLSIAHTKVTGIQLTTTGNVGFRVNAHDIVVDRCIAKGSAQYGYVFDSGAVNGLIKNSLAYDCGYHGFWNNGESASTCSCLGCTAVDCTRHGFMNQNASETFVCTQCVAYHNGDNATYFDFYKAAGTATYTYCASMDATADDYGATGCHTGISDPFVGYAGDDFHLDAGATDLLDSGNDLYGSGVTTDIDSDTLTARVSIGADEYVAAGGPTPITVTRTDNLNG